jgi:hypothetical protein
MDSSISKKVGMTKLWKSIRSNHLYPRAPVKPEVDQDFRSHSSMLYGDTAENGFLENVENDEITKIHKTQSSVPSSTCKTGSWLGFSRSPEHGSFVKLRKMDSLTTITFLMVKNCVCNGILGNCVLWCKNNYGKVTILPEVRYIEVYNTQSGVSHIASYFQIVLVETWTDIVTN